MDRVGVFLLDDHELVRRGLRDVFAAADGIEVVGESGTAAEGLPAILATKPHVAVLDARLPDGSGIDVCRDVRSKDESIRALILTSYDDEAVFSAILAGASGYVLKDVRGTRLVDAIRKVALGHSMLDPAVTARVMDQIRRGPQQPEELRRLSEREQDILAYIAEGLTNREIAARTYLADQTIKSYVSSILSKLGLERRTQAAVLAAKILGDNHRHR